MKEVKSSVIETYIYVPSTTDGESVAEAMGVDFNPEMIKAKYTFNMKDVLSFFEYSTNDVGQEELLGKTVIHYPFGENFIVDIFYSKFKKMYYAYHEVD